jgi:hypothetical protein
MQKQNTIFMALENVTTTTTSILSSSSLHHHECGQCNKPLTKSQKYYCSRKCQKEFYKIECFVCHKRVKGRILHGVQTRKYCSRGCSDYDLKGKPKVKKYSKYNYCETCVKWIPKEDAILKQKGTEFLIASNTYKLKRDNYYCNICKSRLVVKKGKPKEIKRIE